MWGYFDGDLGIDCNENLSEDLCNQTGRARGAVFAVFLIILIIHAFVCKHPTQSVFRMNWLENRALMWSALGLLISVFPVIYIPVINDKVFLLFPIKWEWGMVVASALVFVAVTEAYKLFRRHLDRKNHATFRGDGHGEEAFSQEKRVRVDEQEKGTQV